MYSKLNTCQDTGAKTVWHRRSRVALQKGELAAGRTPITHAGVVGQVWRGGARQAWLARLLPALDVQPLDELLGRRTGALLARSRTTDVVDAALVLLPADGDLVLTSDPSDLVPLAAAAGLHVDVTAV
ncbi:MAG: hypothetical protein H0V89_05565 [Deltaproteobacteria bacterium]|nr:hypothetical protein [Deltaproteobacteria bacterium]